MAITRGRGEVLPHSLESERAVIGACFLDGKAFVRCAEVVRPSDFFDPKHEAIWQAMWDLFESGSPIDEVLVAERMRGSGSWDKLRAVGHEMYFAELLAQTVTAENAPWHAAAVAKRAQVRDTVLAAGTIAETGKGAYGDPDEFVEGAVGALLNIQSRAEVQPYEHSRKVLTESVAALEKRFEERDSVIGAPSFFAVDAITRRMRAAEVTYLGARPGMGKSAYAACVQLRCAQAGIPSLVFSIEMRKEAWVERQICALAGIDSERLQTAQLSGRDWTEITRAASLIAGYPIWIDGSGSITIGGIRRKVKRWRADPKVWDGNRDRLGLVIVDFVQRVGADKVGKNSNREQEVAAVSRGLTEIAKTEGVAILALAALGRKLEERGDKRPTMADFRESGSIESDADVALGLYRDEVYKPDSPDKGIAEVIVLKNRTGRTGTARVAFHKQFTRFADVDERSGSSGADHWQDDA